MFVVCTVFAVWIPGWCAVFVMCSVCSAMFSVQWGSQVDVQYESGDCQSSGHHDGVKVCPLLSETSQVWSCVCVWINLHQCKHFTYLSLNFFHAIIGKGLDQSLREHKDISGHFAKIWSYIQPPIPQFVQSVVLSFAPTSRVCQFEKVFKEMLSHLKIPASRVCLF